MIGNDGIGESGIGDFRTVGYIVAGEIIPATASMVTADNNLLTPKGSIIQATASMVETDPYLISETIAGEIIQVSADMVEADDSGGIGTVAGEIIQIEAHTLLPIIRATRRLEFNLTPIGQARETYIAWQAEEPEGTAVTVEYRLDGETTWTEASNGGSISSIEGLDNTLGRRLHVRQILTSDSETTTPELSEFRLEATV